MRNSDESLIRRIKTRLLPPSSRSFHSCMGELREANRLLAEQNENLRVMLERNKQQTDQLLRHIDAQSIELSDLREHINVIDNGINSVASKCDVMAKHNEIRFETAARMLYDGGINETPLQTRKRIFRYLPNAEGDKLLMQQANAKLMSKLDKICQDNNLDYWFAYGTLIGTLARSSSIPWDDDIDICMMRDDIRKLSEACTKIDDVQLTLVYDLGPLCRQIRFSSTDINIPCFIDVSIYDWACDATQETDNGLREIRRDLMHELRTMSESGELPYWNERCWLFANGSGFVPQVADVDINEQDCGKTTETQKKIQAVFDKYNEKARESGWLCEEKDATAIAYAIDNIYDAPWRRITWEIEKFLPPQKHAYDEYEFCIPNKADDVANECYPGWPYFPDDILGHNHFASNIINDDVRKALKRYIEEE